MTSWLSIDLRFKMIQVIWLSNDLKFKRVGCQLMRDSNYFVKRSFSARLPSKLKL